MGSGACVCAHAHSPLRGPSLNPSSCWPAASGAHRTDSLARRELFSRRPSTLRDASQPQAHAGLAGKWAPFALCESGGGASAMEAERRSPGFFQLLRMAEPAQGSAVTCRSRWVGAAVASTGSRANGRPTPGDALLLRGHRGRGQAAWATFPKALASFWCL